MSSPAAVLKGAVPSTYVRVLYDYLAAKGLDGPGLLGAAAPGAGDRGLGRTPVRQWADWLALAAAALDDPLLGLRLGARITPAHFGVMGYVLLACPHLGAALARLEQYQRLFYDVNPLRIGTQGQSLLLEWGTAAGRPGALVDECALATLVQLSRDICGPAAQPEAVAFVNPAPADAEPYRAYFGCPVSFGAASTSVQVPLATLALPLRAPDAALLTVLETQAAALLAALPQADDFAQSVAQAIARRLREGEPALGAVADDLHVSTRTLHRRLEASGQNFHALREQTRQRLACDYLADPRLTLAEIAQLLGYSEQSAFNRAFRRWQGMSPRAYQRSGSATKPPCFSEPT